MKLLALLVLLLLTPVISKAAYYAIVIDVQPGPNGCVNLELGIYDDMETSDTEDDALIISSTILLCSEYPSEPPSDGPKPEHFRAEVTDASENPATGCTVFSLDVYDWNNTYWDSGEMSTCEDPKVF